MTRKLGNIVSFEQFEEQIMISMIELKYKLLSRFIVCLSVFFCTTRPPFMGEQQLG